MQRVLPMLALVFSIAFPAQGIAQDALRSDHVLYFAVGWRVNEPSAQNVLQLGTVFRCGDAWCLEYEEFPGKDNISRTPLPYRHEMEAPYGKGRCINEHLTTIHGVIHGDVPAQLIEEENGFIIRADIYEYTWKRDISPAGGFALASVRETGSDVIFEQPIGFAYESEDQKGRQVRPGDLTGYFDGQQAHKDMLMGVMDDWSEKQSSMDFRKFRVSSNQPLLGFDQPGLPEAVRKYNKMMWVHHSVLPTQAVSGRLNYILHEYGHDFNTNGCFDEFGHNKLLLPVLHSDRISALVYIEYTPDKRDGVPMISVGRYYRKQQ